MKPQLIATSHPQAEAQYIVHRVLEELSGGASPRELAVLFRAAFHSQALELELTKANVPYEYRGGMRFFERAHIKDVVAHLRVVQNSKDEVSWVRALSLAAGVGPTTAQKIASQIISHETIEQIVAAQILCGGRAQLAWSRLRDVLASLNDRRETPGEMIRTLVSASYRSYLEMEYPDAKDRLDDLEQLAVFAEQSKDLGVFLSEVSLTETFGARRQKEVQKKRSFFYDSSRKVLNGIVCLSCICAREVK